MAKMFYTLDETRAALGQTEDQVKQLTRDGRLREFRDGPRLMFKADQVEALKAQIGGGGGGLEFADSGAPIGLADTRGGSGVPLSLADSIGSGLSSVPGSGLGSGLGSGIGSGGTGSGMMNLKEDTALAADLGLSGTVGGIPSPGRTGGSMGGTGSGTGGIGSRHGVNVFGDDTHLPADPMAQTAMSGHGSGTDLNLEGVGSGSGLLDLTRESDETSLGAELIDEINTPRGGGRPLAPPDTGSMAAVRLESPGGGVVRTSMGMGPAEVVAKDHWSTAFGAAALGAGLFLLFALFALSSAVFDVHPEIIGKLSTYSIMVVLGIGAGIVILFGVFGKLIDASFNR